MDKNVITAKVYHTNDYGVHYVKLEMFGMYISDITVRKSPKHPGGELWVIMPQFKRTDGTYKKIIEFPNDLEFKKRIEDICRRAVKNHIDSGQLLNASDFPDGDLMPQEEYKKRLDSLPYK